MSVDEILRAFRHTCPKCGSSAFEVNDLKHALELAYNAGHEHGMDDEAMIRIRQEPQGMMSGGVQRMRSCSYCGTAFTQRSHNQAYCSYTCRYEALTERRKGK